MVWLTRSFLCTEGNVWKKLSVAFDAAHLKKVNTVKNLAGADVNARFQQLAGVAPPPLSRSLRQRGLK
jgi:hypothetical protein